MFDYKKLNDEILQNIELKKGSFRISPSTRKAFITTNQNICIPFLAKWFLDHHIDLPMGVENLKKPFETVAKDTEHDADLGTFKARFYNTYSGVYSVFYLRKDNTSETKYTKWFLCKTIVTCYNIISTIFVRAKLDLIFTDMNLYYVLFSSPHSYEISISLYDIFTRYGIVDEKQFQRTLNRAISKNNKKEDNPEEVGSEIQTPTFQIA